MHSSNSTRIPVGISGLRRTCWDTAANPHLLICGPTGCGKSTVLRTLLNNTGPDTDAIVIDGKEGLDFFDVDQRFNVYGSCEAAPTMAGVAINLEYRINLLRHYRVNDYRKLPNPQKRRVIVIDELADLLGGFMMEKEETATFRTALRRVLHVGRAAGFHIVGSILRPDATAFGKVEGGMMRDQFSAKIALGEVSKDLLRMLALEPGKKQKRGRGVSAGLTRGPDFSTIRTD